MVSSPNKDVVSPKDTSNVDVPFGNQKLNVNNNASDNAGSSPNTGIVSPNIDSAFRTSSKKQVVEANYGASATNRSSLNNTLVSSNTRNEINPHLPADLYLVDIAAAVCITVDGVKDQLAKMQEDKTLIREGSKKSGIWKLIQ